VQLKVGQRWRGAGSPVEVIVIRAGADDVGLSCGGIAMVAAGDADAGGTAGAVDPQAPPTQIGKRYTTESGELELLCVKGGPGELAADGIPLRLKEPKSLPSSD
jgi:hypothetical protein